MDWTNLVSTKRLGMERYHGVRRDDRTEFQRDFDRLIFSAAFRRLQNKTQVFPLPGSIFVHNRLTHSLEVSSVGRSLGNDVSRRLIERHKNLQDSGINEAGSIVSAACLAHDLGNPPFGHSGERAIDTFFSEGGGTYLKHYQDKTSNDILTNEEWNDLIHFEGNANTFRLLTHHFIGRREGGFVMTYTTLASIVKYPHTSNLTTTNGKFGFFKSETPFFQRIAEELQIPQLQNNKEGLKYARHPFVYLVEAADDICYEIMDIEDAHKLKILRTDEVHNLMLAFFNPERQKQITDILNTLSDANEQVVYLRSCVIGLLEKECVEVFVENETDILNGRFTGRLLDHVTPPTLTAFRNLEKIAYKKIYRSKDVVDIELAGYKVITTLLELMTEAVCHPQKAYSKILINRVSGQYDINAVKLYDRLMAVLDYISGMTDVYALDLYRKINGTSLPLI